MRGVLKEKSRALLEARYLHTHDNGQRETIDGLWRRVSGGNEAYEKLMRSFDFMPNSPALFNAHTGKKGTLSACFVFHVADALLDGEESITNVRTKAAAVAKWGGGVGYYLGYLRPKGDPIQTIHRKACGPVAVLRDYQQLKHLITQGGKRDLAQMGILDCYHADIREFIHLKDENPKDYNSFNISVAWIDTWLDEVKRKQPGEPLSLWNEQIDSAWKTGDPGVYFYDVAERLNPTPWLGQLKSTNPCLTGDTLVAVADGRGHVPIRQLADEEKDIPVYCADDDDQLTIRMMRHPRLTGVRKKIYKVVLDDGLEIRVTGNHKFKIRDGGYVEASELEPGDSLALLTKYFPESVDTESQSYADRYVGLQCGGQYYMEHRQIAAWTFGRAILPTEHVHHIDNDRFNNSPCNLEIIDEFSHLSEHAIGSANGNYGGVDNATMIDHGSKLTRSLGRRFSRKEWREFARENNLPVKFSAWREESLGTLTAFARHCAVLEDVAEYADIDPRVVRTYQNMLAGGLDAEIIDGRVFVHKSCEACGDGFTVPSNSREVCFCSISCVNRRRDTTKAAVSIKATAARKQEKVKTQQLEVYTALKNKLEREPQKAEWVSACRVAGVSAEISRKTSPFRTWQNLKESASVFNHRVVSVYEDGHEDVYNGTVDDYHNFFVGGWDGGATENGRRKVLYINNLQCGEVPLRSGESCNLGSINLSNFVTVNREVDWNRLYDVACLATRFLDDILDWNHFPVESITRETIATRKLGLGVMAWADMLCLLHIHYDTPQAVDLGAKVMKTIDDAAYETSIQLAQEKGPYSGYNADLATTPPIRNATRTCIAPTGSIYLICGADGSSIEPHFELEWDRKTYEGIILHEKVEAIEESGGFIPKVANTIATEWHIKHQAAFQKHVNLACSKTVSMPNSATREDISDAYLMMWSMGCKGGTVYRDRCRDDQVLVKPGEHTAGSGFDTKSGKVTFLPSNDPVSLVNVLNTLPAEDLITVAAGLAEATASAMVKAVLKAWKGSPILVKLSKERIRRKLPCDRQSITHKFHIVDFEGYLTIGLYEDGTPGEIFFKASKEGSTISGLLDAWAMAVSLALQYGCPLETMVRLNFGTIFEPRGMTRNKDIPVCTSIADYTFRYLSNRFLCDDSKDQLPALEGSRTTSTNTNGNLVLQSTATVTKHRQIRSGVFCPECHSEAIYQGGCFECGNRCGWSKCG